MTDPDARRPSKAPAADVPSDAGVGRVAKSPRARTSAANVNRRSRPARVRALIETAGPEPQSNLDDVKLVVGVIGGTHGVQGELKLKLLTDHPDHLQTVSTVYLGDSDTPVGVSGLRFTADQAIIHLEGVNSPEEARALGGLKVRIAGKDAKPLEEGEYFLFQLIGLQAVDGDGQTIGVVTDLMETGAHDVLVIRNESGSDLLVPNHPQYVHEISPDEGKIVIEPPVYDS